MKPLWRDWNEAIGKAIFSTEHADRVVYLAIDEEEIEAIGGQLGQVPGSAFASFRHMMRDEIAISGWPRPDPVKAGQFPRYLTHLAAQVVAAFQMHDDGQTSDKAYWRRLREFLGQPPADARPEGLESGQHTALWQGLKHWANVTNDGRLGLVRLAEKKKEQHYLIAEPLGQCLMRRADLARLRDLFAKHRPLDQGADLGRTLRDLVDEARYSLPGKYFTKHGLRLLEDPARSAPALEQIEAEYRRFLAKAFPVGTGNDRPPGGPSGQSSGAGPGRRPPDAEPPPLRAETTVLLEIARGVLRGGLYRLGEGPPTRVIEDVGEVLWRCYLRARREGPKPPHKPAHDDFLMATRDDEFGAFQEREACRAGDDALLLVPEFYGQTWLDDANPRLFVAPPRLYRPPRGDGHPDWAPLEGLPSGWLALRFKAREDLSGVTLDGKWMAAVSRRAMGLRAVGGLMLRRGVWMLGAGPTLQVVGPELRDHVLVDGEPYPLDAARRATPVLGPGFHHGRLPDSESRELRIRVVDPCRAAPVESLGWRRVEGGWPALFAERRGTEAGAGSGSGTLHGLHLSGDWPPVCCPEPVPVPEETVSGIPSAGIPDALAAMILAAGLRSGGRRQLPDPRLAAAARSVAGRSPNPLLRGMLRAGHTANRPRAGRV